MEILEISASIRIEKLTEFNQSKLTFLEGLQLFQGYIGYTESPGFDYHLVIKWDNRANLDLFIKSELYRYFNGAIQILCSKNELLVRSEIKTDF